MIQEAEIREQMANVVEDRLSLDDFEDWIVRQSWNMHRDSNEDAQSLASEIELALAEHSSNHLGEQELRALLRSLLGEIQITAQVSVERIAPKVIARFTANDYQVVIPQAIRVSA